MYADSKGSNKSVHCAKNVGSPETLLYGNKMRNKSCVLVLLCIYPKIFQMCQFDFFRSVKCNYKRANSDNPDQTALSDLGLYCTIRPTVPSLLDEILFNINHFHCDIY